MNNKIYLASPFFTAEEKKIKTIVKKHHSTAFYYDS